MSHLIHVIAYKKYLTEQGVTCPIEQSEILVEPFTRAVMRYVAFRGGMTQEVSDSVWKQLDVWNKVSPIKASQIFQKADWRLNNLHGALVKTGGLPPCRDYTTVVTVADEVKDSIELDVTQNEQCIVLVEYLLRELAGANHE